MNLPAPPPGEAAQLPLHDALLSRRPNGWHGSLIHMIASTIPVGGPPNVPATVPELSLTRYR